MSSPFRRFQVVKKVQESSVISSFYLRPEDGDAVWPAKAGQYLTLRMPTPDGAVLRTYSVSSDVSNTETYRISVKREAAPVDVPDAPDGVGSCWLHDQVEVGSTLEIAAPRGTFILDESSQRPVLLLSGGVGQTPLLSMLHCLAKTSREAWYLHACENGAVHALQAEVNELVDQAGEHLLHSVVVYRQPLEADYEAQGFDSMGFIDKAFLQSLLPMDDYEVYLCGPTAFMVAMYQLLTELGVAKSRITYEFFGDAASLEALAFGTQQEQAPKTSSMAATKAPAALGNLVHITNPDAWAVDNNTRLVNAASSRSGHAESSLVGSSLPNSAHSGTESSVSFSRSGLTVEWSGANTSLLQLAEQHGLTPNFSCRSGICNSCKSPLIEGEVEYFEQPLEPPNGNEVLLCCSRPLGRVVIDL